MFACVYGPEWDDIAYFSEFHNAYEDMEKCADIYRTMRTEQKGHPFAPYLIHFVNGKNGRLVASDMWKIIGNDIVSTNADDEWGLQDMV